jgi:hypothetical protein
MRLTRRCVVEAEIWWGRLVNGLSVQKPFQTAFKRRPTRFWRSSREKREGKDVIVVRGY